MKTFKTLTMKLMSIMLAAGSTFADARPNIIVIMADDMGYGDISCFGSKAIHTPHLDDLAENGVKLNSFYASSPICTPSRFTVLTGTYASRSSTFSSPVPA